MIYTMHVVAAQTLQACTPRGGTGPRADALRAIAAGEHLTTIAFSEKGTRSHFWAQLVARRASDGASRHGSMPTSPGSLQPSTPTRT